MVGAIGSPFPKTAEHAAPRAENPRKVHDTAQQFEAVLIGQLLKTSREAGGSGWLGTGDGDDAGQTGMELAEQEFARMLAAKGGLGMSHMIEAGMRAKSTESGQ